MALSPGSRLGVYEITAQIGEGGMGAVYRATDTSLGRQVAVKVLPDAFAADPERLARFEREAKTLASLNHPHIAAIYALEKSAGQHALVMELVEGEDLSQRIARGAIPVEEALPIATQIAEALEAAHEQGIIHRDLKPANIKVRDDGTVKVLDFGLAKLAESTSNSNAALANSPTFTSPVMMTGIGVLLGTAAYMSPEQAKGKPADKRSDVWAFGAVLYEMLTGTRAFDGDDMTDVLGAVVRLEPDWSRVPAAVPAAIRTLLQGCLVKDRRLRVGDIAAVRFVLQTPSLHAPAAAIASSTAPRTPVWRQALPWAAGIIVGAGLAAGTAVWMRPAAAPSRVARFVIPTPAEPPVQFSVGAIPFPIIAISPDGSRLVYRMTRGLQPFPGNGVMYQRSLGQVDGSVIPGMEGANGFTFFSPDGRWIGFTGNLDQTLKRIAVTGGPAQTICPLDGALQGASWGPDDTIVFATVASKGLRRVPAAGGKPQAVTTVDPTKGETDHWWPEILPDGKAVIFNAWSGTAEQSRILVLSLGSGKVSEVVRGGSQPHLSPTGHLVYAVGRTLNAVRFDTARLAAVGDPVPLIDGVSFTPPDSTHYALAGDGSLVYIKAPAFGAVPPRTLVWVNRQGREEAIKVPPRAYTYARLSPDGTRVALDVRDEQSDIWIWDLSRETLQRLTNDPGMNRMPVWTPNGTRVAFTAERDGVESIHWQKADGSGAPERLSIGSTAQGPFSFSPDGTRLVFQTPLANGARPHLGMLSLDGERREELLFDPSFVASNAAVSPDGHWLAYESRESGQQEVYLAPFPDAKASKRPVSTRGGTRPLWSKDGRELFYYVEPDAIMAVPVRLGSDVVLGTPQVVVKGPYAAPINSGRHYDVLARWQTVPPAEGRRRRRGRQASPARDHSRSALDRRAEGETPGREVESTRCHS